MIYTDLPNLGRMVVMVLMVVVAMVAMVANQAQAFLHCDAGNPLFFLANCVWRCWDE